MFRSFLLDFVHQLSFKFLFICENLESRRQTKLNMTKHKVYHGLNIEEMERNREINTLQFYLPLKIAKFNTCEIWLLIFRKNLILVKFSENKVIKIIKTNP